MSGLWGDRGAGQLCFRAGVCDEQASKIATCHREDKVGRLSEHRRKLSVSLLEVFLTFAHITGSSSGLRPPSSGMVVLGKRLYL